MSSTPAPHSSAQKAAALHRLGALEAIQERVLCTTQRGNSSQPALILMASQINCCPEYHVIFGYHREDLIIWKKEKKEEPNKITVCQDRTVYWFFPLH